MDKKLNIKIYGVTTVGPKGQVIIPRDCRPEFGINIGDDRPIITIDNIAFGLPNPDNGDEICEDGELDEKSIDCFGSVKIGTKHQFVIPSEIRSALGIKSGDSLVVIGKEGEGIGFVRNDNIDYFFAIIKKKLSSV
ncbi:AbrB/MazE/SpoVT family DNA-binding domain-containing protein [Candidatus Gracilibacteria bacterium 28_42_T64]|nr:AbrB/MazE/SpoVT family DNA-binding domain-containing protein [Candidatus Gracilibacteria bacterium 28_42_T64]